MKFKLWDKVIKNGIVKGVVCEIDETKPEIWILVERDFNGSRYWGIEDNWELLNVREKTK